jgi:hypothetical protein
MAALSLSIDAIRPLNRWHYDRIQPGSVGSVGDVNLTPRFKHSYPAAPLRFDPYFSGKNSTFLGSNVQDGGQKSYDSNGGPAYTVDSNWGGRKSFKTNHGYIYQDLREPDKSTEAVLGSVPAFSYKHKVASVLEAKRTGDKFLPLPKGYVPSSNQSLRGGSFPHIRDMEPGTIGIGSQLLPTEQSIREFRAYNERDYQRSLVGRVPNLKPRK